MRTTGVIFLTLLLFLAANLSAQSPEELTLERAIECFKAEGGSFEYEDYLLPPVPDEENFGAIEVLRGMAIPDDVLHPSGIDGAKVREKLSLKFYAEGLADARIPGVGAAMFRFDPELGIWESYLTGRPTVSSTEESARIILEVIDARWGEIIAQTDAAIERPQSRLTPPPSDFFQIEKSTTFQMDYCISLISLSRLCTLRNSAAVHLNKAEIAMRSLLTQFHLLRMAETSRTGIINQFVAFTQFAFIHASSWEVLEKRLFDEPSLKLLQQKFQSMDLVLAFAQSLRLEALSHIVVMRDLFSNHPRAEVDAAFPELKGVTLSDALVDEMIAHYLDGMTRTNISPLTNKDYAEQKRQAKLIVKSAAEREDDPRYLLLNFNLLLLEEKMGLMAARHDAYRKHLVVACALERYFLRHKRYPESLKSLTPEFLDAIPKDPMDHEPIRYRITKDGRYLLYFIGADFEDNGGIPTPSNKLNQKGTDWVWRYSAEAK